MSNAAAFAALRKIRRAVNRLAEVPSRVARDGASEIKALIGQQFAAQTDAYGRPWAQHEPATVERWGAHAILNLTGALADVDVKPLAGAGIGITLGAKYGAFHQVGTARMVARPILPDGPLPDSWRAALAGAGASAFDDIMSEAK